jgi:hypothetical protein
VGVSSLSFLSGKTLTVNNSLTFAGTDGTIMTFPSTSATIARTDAANTFTGHQTIEGVTSTGATGTGKFVFDGSPTLVTPVIGAATGTSLSVTGQLTSTVATGTAPLAVSSTTAVANLTASSLTVAGRNFAAPGAIGGTTPGAGTFTTVTSGTAGTTTGFVDLGAGATLSAMTAQSTATCTPITNMAWNLAANKAYILQCHIPRTLGATATLQYCLGGPGTATSYSLSVQGANGTSGAWSETHILSQTAYATKTPASTAAANTAVDDIYAFIQNGSTASGTQLTLQTAANGNNITVLANASCTLTQTN